jgi:DNA gyrase subunit B
MALDNFQEKSKKVERWLRDPRVVELLADPLSMLDTKVAFQEKANLQPIFDELKNLKLSPEWEADEEHSGWMVTFLDPTSARRKVNVELVEQPEYRQMRALAKNIAKHNRPPFLVVKQKDKEKDAAGSTDASPATPAAATPAHVETHWRDLLVYLRNEGMRDVQISRYKGLGEMNAEQLAETTMDAEKRTLLRIELKDMVESDEIFSTLMGENVEERRKFIEEHALDVRNLDV